jgi:hypothetical protein
MHFGPLENRSTLRASRGFRPRRHAMSDVMHEQDVILRDNARIYKSLAAAPKRCADQKNGLDGLASPRCSRSVAPA